MMQRIETLLAQKEPTIAAVFASDNDLAQAEIVARSAHIAEFRSDLIQLDPIAKERRLQGLAQLMPTLLTARHQREGGQWHETEPVRLAHYQHLIHYAHAADIEVRSRKIAKEVITITHELGKPAIASFHDFESTPKASELSRYLDEGLALGADYVKFALMARTADDYDSQLQFLIANKDYPLIMVGMSDEASDAPYGPISRIVFPYSGSHLTFGCIGAPVAPGQMSVEALAHAFALVANR